MKKNLPVISIALIAIATTFFSCKKDKNTAASQYNIVGNYRVIQIEQFNTDSTITYSKPTGCSVNNICTFDANGGYFESTGCSTDTIKGTFYITGQTLSIKEPDGYTVDDGVITNYSGQGFTIDEHAANYRPDAFIFQKL